jgi:TPR repeat protein
VERLFVVVAYIPSVSLETTQSARFAIPTELKKTDEDRVEELMKRVEANDAGATHVLGSRYYYVVEGLLQDREKAIELYARAAELGDSEAHNQLG